MNELMEGVRVLSENVITYNNTFFMFVFSLFTIVTFTAGILCFTEEKEILGGIALIMLGIFFGIGIIITDWETTTQTQYKVTISDTVNFKEFTQKYEVISVDGEIYAVIEKKVEEE